MKNVLEICEELGRQIGAPLPSSNWVTVEQSLIDAFAVTTNDHQFIHLDEARARAETPFGGTIAHGFLTLSFASSFAYEVMRPIEAQTASINYGFDKIRFLAPVRAGRRIRGNFELTNASPKGETAVLQTHKLTIEIEGSDTPALVADWLTLHQLA